MDGRLQHAPIGVLDVTAAGTVDGANSAAREVLDLTGADPTGCSLEAMFPSSVEDSLLVAFEGEAVTSSEFEEFYPTLDRWLAITVVPSDNGSAGTIYVQDVTGRRRAEQRVDRLHDERDRTELIEALLSEVLTELVGVTARDELVETVCAALGESDLYEFAWVGERDVGGDDIVVRAAAGETGETFAAIRDALDGAGTTPAERAVERGERQVVHSLADDSQVPNEVRMAAFADGVRSLLAIPLVAESSVYGVVCVYASGEDAFSARECASFETLGEVAGFAITAARNRHLLRADTVTEVTFAVGQNSPLVALGRELNADLSLAGVVPQNDDCLCYVAVDGATVEDLDTASSTIAGIRGVRVLDDTATGGAVELRIGEQTPVAVASSLAGSVREATYEGGTGRIVAELPPDQEVRRTVEAIGRLCDAEAVAKRERDRSVTTAREFRATLADRLTDRQATVLRTAYLANYFESPRGSTAEEVASSLDITGSTLLYHLRASQRKLLDAYYGDDGMAMSENE
ncbi:bacterio-opsin activator domain-containing protein [Haloarchaeobius sp. DFWS5]|uniref:bacterio-opsin activator domain-containing protein n=1 Tax=Haloarchaeobius sp. DFWS5 TaxID=3446114 RepID=UPI003EB8F671